MQVCIIGLGLIGGSMGLALKRAAGKYRVAGYARRSITGFQAVKMGVIDTFEGNLELAVRDADIVIAATPILAVREVFETIAGSLKKGCIVSDVGSTKKQIASWAKSLLPRGTEFVGGHPMAGKEKAGIDYAEAGLFEGCTYCLVPGSRASQSAVLTMREMVEDLRAKPVLMEAEKHDRLVAAISHLPFMVSCALFSSARESDDWEKTKSLASSGFRDTTRLASGDPTMYRDICVTNRKNIKARLKDFRASLKNLEDRLNEEDEDLLKAFNDIKKARDEWVAER